MSGYTRQEVAQRAGIDPEYVDRLVELGILTPGAGEAFSPGDLRRARWMQGLERAGVPLIQLQLSEGFRPVVIERWLRVYADSLRRIAETETAWWNSEIVMPPPASGTAEGEMLEAQADLGSQMTPLIDQALLAIYHGQQEHTWSQVFVEHVESALEQAALYRRLDRPPAVCFLDITGYTQPGGRRRGRRRAGEVHRDRSRGAEGRPRDASAPHRPPLRLNQALRKALANLGSAGPLTRASRPMPSF